MGTETIFLPLYQISCLFIEVFDGEALFHENDKNKLQPFQSLEQMGVMFQVVSLFWSLQLDGGNATLTVAELKKAYPNINQLDGLSIYIKASVMTSTGRVPTWHSGLSLLISLYGP